METARSVCWRVVKGLVGLSGGVLGLIACGDRDGGNHLFDASSDGVDAGEPDGGLPSMGALGPEWNELRPGGETVCGDGSPWAFFVRRGTANRILLELQGGGGCWSEQSCFIDKTAVTSLRREPDLVDKDSNAGLHDHGDARNPFKDWHHVIVSYCTGDQHWGDAVQTYGGRVFHHKGAVNSLAALDWVFRNVPSPEQVFVTGHSAGAYGSVSAAAIVAHQYPGVPVVQLGDSGVGAVGVDQPAPAVWNIAAHYPTFVGGDPTKIKSINELYRLVGAAFPEMRMAELTSAYDWNQAEYYRYMGGTGGVRAWSSRARGNVDELERDVGRFTSYVSPGYFHVIENRPDFYTLRVDGVSLWEWVGALATGLRQPASVSCAEDCGAPIIGDTGAVEEWACLTSPQTPPTPDATTADVVFLLTHPGGVLAPNVPVKTCARTDHACDAPIATATTDGIGAVPLTLPTGAQGFDGFLMTRGDGSFTDRFYFRPPLRRSFHQWMTGPTWEYSTPARVTSLAAAFGKTADPSKGVLAVLTLDCAGSVTTKTIVRVDGRAPDGFWAPGGNNTKAGGIAYFLNLDGGVHPVTVTTLSGTPLASDSFFVGAGSFTSVFGLGPGY